MESIQQHYIFLSEGGELENRSRLRLQAEVNLLIREMLVKRWEVKCSDERYKDALDRVFGREISPWQAMELLVDE
jgi:putative protein kinase ArgK-like GTPase of G3E family